MCVQLTLFAQFTFFGSPYFDHASCFTRTRRPWWSPDINLRGVCRLLAWLHRSDDLDSLRSSDRWSNVLYPESMIDGDGERYRSTSRSHILHRRSFQIQKTPMKWLPDRDPEIVYDALSITPLLFSRYKIHFGGNIVFLFASATTWVYSPIPLWSVVVRETVRRKFRLGNNFYISSRSYFKK